MSTSVPRLQLVQVRRVFGKRLLVCLTLCGLIHLSLGQQVDLDTQQRLHSQRALLELNGPKPSEEGSCALVRSLPNDANRCTYVLEHCHTDAKIPYLRLYYCYVRNVGFWASAALQVGCIMLLLLLFALLGSTAEDFFSPILTQISQELGLPPRFAGVTFLALGNGAPDISASIAAVKMGAYPLALAGLFGGGMFVGCAVSGVVILLGNGATARGALLRDVTAYLLSLLTVVGIFMSAHFTRQAAIGLLCMYIGFVVIVLAADTYHILSTRPGRRREKDREPLLNNEETLIVSVHKPPVAEFLPPPEVARTLRSEVEMTESPDNSVDSDASGPRGRNALVLSHPSCLDDLLHPLTYEERVHLTAREFRERALMEQELAEDEGSDGEDTNAAMREGATPSEGYVPPVLEEVRFAVTVPRSAPPENSGGETPGSHGDRQRPDVEDLERRAQLAQEPLGSPRQGGWGSGPPGQAGQPIEAPPWSALLNKIRWIIGLFMVLEYPFVMLRRATIPLVEAEGYSRPWFLVSLVGAPLAVCLYLELPWQAFVISGAAGGLAALGFGLFVPVDTEPPFWGCGTGFPIGATVVAVAGFVVAAMWIDTIASELVGLLDYFGVLLGLDHAILGMTILAWGNSIGDMVTDVAIARRGLPNMAITACFAGPVFNLLIALGGGFLRLIGTDAAGQVPVRLSPLDAIGAGFLISMCLMVIIVGIVNRWHLPRNTGFAMIGLYVAYLVTSIAYVAQAKSSGGS
eukprot:jgi/Botrbrau1/1853/Bobra.146_1s0044.1